MRTIAQLYDVLLVRACGAHQWNRMVLRVRYNHCRLRVALVLRMHVKLALRLLLTAVLLISQVSFGASACACHVGATQATPQSALTMTCPVTGEAACHCCQAKDEPRHELTRKVIAPDSGTCKVVSSRTACVEPARKVLQVSSEVAVLPEPVELNDRLIPVAEDNSPSLPKTLATSSVIRAHGLRAPPVR